MQKILPKLQGWMTAVRLQELRPDELILDERIPTLLRTLKKPTFITIDKGFWKAQVCHPRYCILCFFLHKDDQEQIPVLLRRLFTLPEFRTRAARMGKVARVSKTIATYLQAGKKQQVRLPFLD